MKRLLLFIIVPLFVLPLCAEGKTALLVWTRDGEAVGYDLGERPLLKFAENDILLYAGDVTVSYPLCDYVRMAFGNWNFESVEEIVAPKALFTLEGDHIVVTGLKPGETVSVYSAGGILQWNGKASDNGLVTIPLEGEGVKVINVSNINFKIW